MEKVLWFLEGGAIVAVVVIAMLEEYFIPAYRVLVRGEEIQICDNPPIS